MTDTSVQTLVLDLELATPESVAPFATLVGSVDGPLLEIPYYPGRVREGGDIGFKYRGDAMARTALLLPLPSPMRWFERHLHLTQLFVGLGREPFAMVLAPPNQDDGGSLPELDQARAFLFEPGTAVLLHLGTWHDFPMALEREITILTMNSEEVIDALVSSLEPIEMDSGDVLKVSLPGRFGTEITVAGLTTVAQVPTSGVDSRQTRTASPREDTPSLR